MKNGLKIVLVMILTLVVIGSMILIGLIIGDVITGSIGAAQAEEYEEDREWPGLYVTASVLNGRSEPTKKAGITAFFDYGDKIQPTGEWSRNGEWVEIQGGENGTAWVYYKFVTARKKPFTVTNENNGKIKVRSRPGGKGRLKGYIRHGKTIEIDQVINGYGHCSRGWVDLDYFIEEIEHIGDNHD